MKKVLFLFLVLFQLIFISGALYAETGGYYYDTCPGCGGYNHREITIPTPTPYDSEGRKLNCYTEEYICGQTCFDGSYDGDRSRQGMGYCIDKTCTRTICK